MKSGKKEYIRPINSQSQSGHPNDNADKSSKKSEQMQKTGVGEIIVKLLITVLALTAAAVLTLFLFVDYNFEYITSPIPEPAAHSEHSLTEGHLTEDDIPPPPYIPVYYDFTQPVPESSAVSFGYFNNTVFIGDSRTKGLLMFTQLTPYDFSSVGLNVASLQEKAFIRLKNEDGELVSYTLFDALEREKENYKAIYIATGLNELGWNVDGFMDAFALFIDDIRTITDVPIYIQLILPVTTYSSETTHYGITNEKCVQFNARLRAFASKQQLFLLDPLSLFTLEDGTLDPAHSSDGIHLNRASCAILAEYYRTHTVDIYAYDNTRPAEAVSEMHMTDKCISQ